MRNTIRLILVVGALAVAASVLVPTAASAREQSKYALGAAGSAGCGIPYTGQSFWVTPGKHFEITVRSVVGGGHVQASYGFLPSERWFEGRTFLDKTEGPVPAGATEVWVTICHTDNEVSYGPVVLTTPVVITYSES